VSGGDGIYGYNTSAGATGAGVHGYGTGTSPGVQGESQSGWGGSFSSLYVTPGTSYFASGVTLNGGATLGANSLLTLGSAASDPAGANGAMYYNTGSNAFRCYVSGAWGGCGIGGSGTTNYVARFTGTSTLGTGAIQDNGSTVSIGGTPAGTALTVVGPTSLSNALIATTNAASGVGIYGFGLGSSSIGVYGQGVGSGVYGNGNVGLQGTGSYAGVTGTTTNNWGYGVLGTTSAGSFVYGVYGTTASTQYSAAGVAGINSGNGMGGYFQSNNATTYALLAYNAGGGAGYAFQAQGTSNFTGAVTMNSSLNVAGFTYLGDAAADQVTINAATLNIPNNLNIDSSTMYLDATNNRIGLGTASPQRQLTVFNSTDAIVQLTNTTAGTGSGDGLLLIESGVNGYIENGESGNLILRTAATDRLTIDSAGNVGVGYAPSYKLDVNGRAFFNGEIAVGGDISSVWTGYGVASSGTQAGGHFYNTNYPNVYGALGYASSGNRYGVYARAQDSSTTNYGLYTYASGGSSANYGVYSAAGNNFFSGDTSIGTLPVNDTSLYVYNDSTAYAYIGRKDGGINGKGIMAYGQYYGGYFNDTDGTAYGYAAWGGYGYYGLGSTAGGYFSGTGGGASVYVGYGSSYGLYVGSGNTYGVYAYGNSTAGRFYDVDGTATTFIAGASYGVEIITGNAIKPGGGSWLASSDRRVKKDISDFKDGIETVRSLKPVNFTYNGLGGTTEGLKSIGFIAQDIEKVAPYLILHEKRKLHPEDSEMTDLLLVDPSAIPFVNMNAIKDIDLRVDGLEAKISRKDEEQDAKVRALEERVEELEARLEALGR